MLRQAMRLIVVTILTAVPGISAHAAGPQVERGRYLVRVAGCTDCHTPGHFTGRPDTTRFLAGSDVGFAAPGQGVYVGPNLTPDRQTGLGTWTVRQIATAITTGVRPDGRMLSPVMPWQDYSHLTKSDALAVAAFLKSLPPASHAVEGPFGPSETPTVPVMSIQPGDVYARLPQPR